MLWKTKYLVYIFYIYKYLMSMQTFPMEETSTFLLCFFFSIFLLQCVDLEITKSVFKENCQSRN